MSGTISRPRLLVALVAVLMLLGGVLLWTESPAEAAKRPKLDHFRCYHVQPNPDVPPSDLIITVQLQDQFDIAAGAMPDAIVLNPELFCNPAEKRHRKLYKISNPAGHLTFYNIATEPGPDRIIRYKNQFAKGRAHLGPAMWLGVPTGKDNHGPAERLDHFKCYKVVEAKAANTVVGLRDQWQTEDQVEVGGPVMFCNPTRKFHAGAAVGVSNARGHLMCYRTGSDPSLTFTAWTFNQFGEQLLTVHNADVLCVPTRKFKKFTVVPVDR